LKLIILFDQQSPNSQQNDEQSPNIDQQSPNIDKKINLKDGNDEQSISDQSISEQSISNTISEQKNPLSWSKGTPKITKKSAIKPSSRSRSATGDQQKRSDSNRQKDLIFE
jgi:hypothetical protein